jgi:predicted metal-dependent HD superfamily phosphohydrolase
MTSKEETMESAEEITTPEEFSNDVAHALASKPRDVLAAILRDRDIAIRLDERQATEAKVREEYAGLVEKAYKEGYGDRHTAEYSAQTRNRDWEASIAKAALEGKVSQ